MVSTVTTRRTPEGFTGAPVQPSKLVTIVKPGANSAPGVIGGKSNSINAKKSKAIDTKSTSITPSEITNKLSSKSDSNAINRPPLTVDERTDNANRNAASVSSVSAEGRDE